MVFNTIFTEEIKPEAAKPAAAGAPGPKKSEAQKKLEGPKKPEAQKKPKPLLCKLYVGRPPAAPTCDRALRFVCNKRKGRMGV